MDINDIYTRICEYILSLNRISYQISYQIVTDITIRDNDTTLKCQICRRPNCNETPCSESDYQN